MAGSSLDRTQESRAQTNDRSRNVSNGKVGRRFNRVAAKLVAVLAAAVLCIAAAAGSAQAAIGIHSAKPWRQQWPSGFFAACATAAAWSSGPICWPL